MAIQVVAVLALLFSGFVLLADWTRLPDTVAVHFGFDGAPDAWGSKRSLLLFPGLGFALFVLLSALERVPHLHNYPRTITPENAPAQYLNSRRLLASLKAVVGWVLAIGLWRTCAVAAGQAEGLGGWFLPATLIAVFGVVGFFLVRGNRAG